MPWMPMVISHQYEKPEFYEVRVKKGCAYFQTPWASMEFRDDLVNNIPPADRRWYPGKKVWAVKIAHLDYFCNRIEYWFPAPIKVIEQGE